ncbi:MAG: YolD-like family protein [Clostridiales bacterium]|nr:YolD-like family protein [Clostridiales bacterium]
MIGENNDLHRYDDIINLPHHVSKSRPQMSTINRAAQFSPFAALTGYEEAVKETARVTDRRIELDEATKAILDEKLRILHEQLSDKPEITVTYFQPDDNKAGGSYITSNGIVKKIDRFNKAIVMEDGARILIEDIISMTGEIIRFVDDYYVQ